MMMIMMMMMMMMNKEVHTTVLVFRTAVFCVCKRRSKNRKKLQQTQVDLVYCYITVVNGKYFKIIPHFSQQNARVGLCRYLM